MESTRLVILVFLFLPSALVVTLCLADCLPEQPSLSELLDRSSSSSSTIIGRFTYTNRLATLVCDLEVYKSNEGYVQKNEFPIYILEEVFQGNLFLVGDEIPIVWDTDTGYREELPGRFNESLEGFLGIVDWVGGCYIDGDYTNPYPEESEERPYSANECNMWNQPWSQLSEEDILFLRGEQNSVSQNNSSGGTHPDIVTVLEVPGEPNPGGIAWADSYSVGSNCYCASNFDHGIGNRTGETPFGPMSVTKVCELLTPGPGMDGRPVYNDIQCGNGPPNSNGAGGDEENCPGRTDIGTEGCGQIGPKWNFENISAPNSNTSTSDSEASTSNSETATTSDANDGLRLRTAVAVMFTLGVSTVLL